MGADPLSNQNWDASQKRIVELLLDSRDVTFSSAQQTELNQLLRSSDRNLKFAAQFLVDGEALRDSLAIGEIAEICTVLKSKPSAIEPGPIDHRSRLTRLALAMSLAIAVGSSFLFFAINRRPLAIVQDQSKTAYAGNTPSADGRLATGTYSLLSGMVAILFRNGVILTTEGPAEFEIEDEALVKVSHGQFRALAPESGHGFTIQTPQAKVEDLGTEFAVGVDAKSGVSLVHVFDGQVDVKNLRGDQQAVSLYLGDSVMIDGTRVETKTDLPLDDFPTLSDVAYSRWLDHSNQIRDDPNLVLYYPFIEDTTDSRTLLDHATTGNELHGKIKGPRWVSGRWPNKKALLFDQMDDVVRVEVPEELTQYTFAAWVNVDHLQFALSSIWNSAGKQTPGTFLQLARRHETFFAIIHPDYECTPTGVKVPLREWIHLAAVVDMENRIATTWVNGELAVRSAIRDDAEAMSGTCWLGGSRRFKKFRSWPRDFRGRIDEAMLWRVALTQEEIRQQVAAGTPWPLGAAAITN